MHVCKCMHVAACSYNNTRSKPPYTLERRQFCNRCVVLMSRRTMHWKIAEDVSQTYSKHSSQAHWKIAEEVGRKNWAIQQMIVAL